MKQRLPTICFDTAVCIKAARRTYPDSEWRAVRKLVVNAFDYAIIPLVHTELMLGVGQGDEAHFEANRAPLKILYPSHKKRFLQGPGCFAVETVLGRRLTGPFQTAEDYDMQARILMRATSKRSLVLGRVAKPRSTKHSCGIDFSLVRDQMDHGQGDHISDLRAA